MTCAEAPLRARGRRGPEAEVISRGQATGDKLLQPRKDSRLRNSQNSNPGSDLEQVDTGR